MPARPSQDDYHPRKQHTAKRATVLAWQSAGSRSGVLLSEVVFMIDGRMFTAPIRDTLLAIAVSVAAGALAAWIAGCV
jgi:hypothetical protein